MEEVESGLVGGIKVSYMEKDFTMWLLQVGNMETDGSLNAEYGYF